MNPPIGPMKTTIANGASLSGAVDTGGGTVCGIAMPGTWTTANLTFQVSADGATYQDLYDKGGTEYTVTAAASRYIELPPADFAGIRFLKVRSGTTGTAVNQADVRALLLNVRPV